MRTSSPGTGNWKALAKDGQPEWLTMAASKGDAVGLERLAQVPDLGQNAASGHVQGLAAGFHRRIHQGLQVGSPLTGPRLPGGRAKLRPIRLGNVPEEIIGRGNDFLSPRDRLVQGGR